MNKEKIIKRVLSCLLVMSILLTSAVSIGLNKETKAAENPTYILKTFDYPTDQCPVLWKYPGQNTAKPLTNTYYRGASIDDKDNFKYVAYCMDWGVKGPSASGSSYDHVTTTISQTKINQLTHVLMNGYSGSDSQNAKSNTFTLTNKYNVNRYGRPLKLTDDGSTGTYVMQTATQIAVWLVMGKDGRSRTMVESDWVPNPNCENLDRDIMEMATTLYHNAMKYGAEINWLSTNIKEAKAGVYNPQTGAKLYGPFIAESDFTKNTAKVELNLSSSAPHGTKILNNKLKEAKEFSVGERFYISVPADADDTTFQIGLLRDMGMVLPLSYEEKEETRQRMFFSSLSSASATLSIVHRKSDASLTINKQVNDAKPSSSVSLSSAEGYTFLVYYSEKSDFKNSQYLGDFETDKDGKITLTGLNPGFYQVVEAMTAGQEEIYEPIIVSGFTDKNGNTPKTGNDYVELANTKNGVISFEIKATGLEKNYNVYYLNQRVDNTRIKITKIDEYTGEYISDVKFNIYKVKPVTVNGKTTYDQIKDADGNVIMWEGQTYDNSMGKVMFGGKNGTAYLNVEPVFTNGKLKAEDNTYLVYEVSAPKGYVANVLKVFTITDENINHINSLYTKVEEYTDNNGIEQKDYYITNRPVANGLKVVKVEKGTTTPIKGVQFNLYEKFNGTTSLIATLTTDKDGVAQYGLLPNGTVDVENALYYGREYFLVEASAPEGYILQSGEIKIPSFTEDKKIVSVAVENEKIKDGSLKLIKKNANGDVLKGTKFALYKVKDSAYNEFDEFFASYKGIKKSVNSKYKYTTYFLNGNKAIDITEIENCLELVKTYETDKNGVIEEDLPHGEYIILETQANEGYQLLNSIYRFSIYQNSVDYVIECVNDPITGSVHLIKTDASTGEHILGAEFTLYKKAKAPSDEDIMISVHETDTAGQITVNGLEYGDYYFIETKTPIRYESPDPEDTKLKTQFTISSQDQVCEVAYTNVEKPCAIVIYKTDKDTGEPLEGVKFALKSGETKIGEAITDADGVATFADMELGEYTLVEIATVDGYKLDGFEPVQISLTEYVVHKIFIGNEKIRGDIKILKVDSETNKPLSGVEFTLYSINDERTPLRTLATDENGVVVFENVDFGGYVVVETKAAEGYRITESKILVDVAEEKEYFYTITNEIIKRTIKLIKVDKDTKIPIADVEFDVYALVDGQYVKYATVVTDEKGECNFTLPFGEYELRETKSGKGYKINDETEKIDLTTEDIEDIMEITITNELIKNRITLRKSGDKLGNYLKGAKYGLYELSTDKLIMEGVTDENGIFCFGTVSYGSYYLKEIEAPEGYTLSKDIHTFKVDETTEYDQIIDVVDTSVPQTGVNSNSTLLLVLSIITVGLFVALLALETKMRLAK